MKKRNKSLFLLFLVLLSASIFFAGCSKKDDGNKNEEVVDSIEKDEKEKVEDIQEDQEEVESSILPDEPNKIDLQKMEDYVEEKKKDSDSFIRDIRTKNADNNWYNILVEFEDDFIEKHKGKTEEEMEKVYKDIRFEVYDMLKNSKVLNFNTDDRTITFHYEDKDGNEIKSPSVIEPETK